MAIHGLGGIRGAFDDEKYGEDQHFVAFQTHSTMRSAARTTVIVQRLSALLAVAIPLVSGMRLLGASGGYTDELTAVRTLLVVDADGSGLVSMLLGQACLLVPFGSLGFRVSLLAALALGVLGWSVHRLASMVLEAYLPRPGWVGLFALLSSLTVTSSHQLAGSSPVEPKPWVATCFLVVLAESAMRARRQSGRAAIAPTALAGQCALATALLVEDPSVSLLGWLLIAPQIVGEIRSRRTLAAAGSGVLLVGLPALSLMQKTSAEALGPARGLGAWFAGWWHGTSPGEGLEGLVRELGPVLGVGLLIGSAASLVPRRGRWMGLQLLAIVFVAMLLWNPRRAASEVTAERLMALVASVVLFAIGVFYLTERLTAAMPRLTELALGLSAAALTLTLATRADPANPSQEGPRGIARAVFVEESLVRLPPAALVLVETRASHLAMLTARYLSGVRPDLLTVPLYFAHSDRFSAELLHNEPMILPLIRDLSVNGRPSEFALSQLADRRGVFVELTSAIDAPLREHILPRGLWGEVMAHAVARSDRGLAVQASRSSLARILRVLGGEQHEDLELTRMVAHRVKEQILFLLAFGDRGPVPELLEQYRALMPTDPWPTLVTRAMEDKPRGAVRIEGS